MAFRRGIERKTMDGRARGGGGGVSMDSFDPEPAEHEAGGFRPAMAGWFCSGTGSIRHCKSAQSAERSAGEADREAEPDVCVD